MELMTSKYRKYILVAAFLLPIVILITMFWLQGYYPFGSKTTIFMDLKGQYMEFLSAFRTAGDPDGSLLFSWSRSMGGNVLGLYAFYSGGMISFIAALFPVEALPLAIEIITLLMIGLSGLTMAVFLEFGVSQKPGRFSVVVFATCYALMSYNMVYANCFMWLNGSIFLPLVLLGIEQILKGKRGLLMYITLTLAMINNYYTAYMICIFSILYMAFRVVGMLGKDDKTGKWNIAYPVRAVLRYIGVAVLSAMSAAPLLFTVFRDLVTGKLTSTIDYDAGNFYYPFREVFKKVLPGQYDSITTENIHPQLYAGLLVLIFAIVFFLIKGIKIKEKVAGFVVIGIMLISFWHVGIDKIWHGFQMPHWFPFRYAFVFGFFLVYLGYRAFDLVVQEGWYLKFAKRFKRKSFHVEIVITALLVVISFVELERNAVNYFKGLDKDFGFMETEEYDSFLNRTRPLVDKVKQEDTSWYRMDKDYEFSKNDSMLLGYKGMTNYSSTYNAAVNTVTPKYGIAQGWYWSSGYGATPLMDSLFGVKYRLATKPMPDLYKNKDVNQDVTLYENTLALPIGYAADQSIVGTKMPEKDVFTNQNDLLSSMIGESSECFKALEYERTDGENEAALTLTAPSDDPLYLYMNQTEGWWGDIYVNDAFVNNYFSLETTCAVYLGTFKAGEQVNISVRSDNAHFDQAWIVSLDKAMLTDRLNKLKNQSLHVSEVGAGSFTGTINLKEGQVIATSLPYDEGQSVYVDGERVDSEKWAETFLAIPAGAGEHTISVSYTPKGWNVGLMLAAVALLIAIAWFGYPWLMKKLNNRKDKQKLTTPDKEKKE